MTVMLIGQRQCRGCGCTDLRACSGGCSWVLLDIDAATGICSECAEAVEWDQSAFLVMGRELGWQGEEAEAAASAAGMAAP